MTKMHANFDLIVLCTYQKSLLLRGYRDHITNSSLNHDLQWLGHSVASVRINN